MTDDWDDDTWSPGDDDGQPALPLDFDPLMMGAEMSTLREDLERLAGVVQDQGDALEKLLDALEATPGGPWLWNALGVPGRRALWLQLGEWVEWLEARWLINLSGEDYHLVPCWFRHPVAVELLTALMVAHRATYAKAARVPSFTLVDWHTRALVPVFGMLRDLKVFKDCVANREHTPPREKAPMHERAMFEAFVDEDAPSSSTTSSAEVPA
jgi:hypothetical protein